MTWRTASLIIAAVAIAVSIPAVRHLREVPPPPEPPFALTLEPPPGTRFAASGDGILDLAINPQGRELVFAASTGGHVELWRRRLDAERSERLPGTSGAMLPAWAPDGSAIWFFSEGMLRVLTLRDGSSRPVVAAPAPAGVAVRSDGAALVAAGTAGITRLEAGAASEATTVRAGERAHAFPAWLGTGNAFVYLVTRGDGRRILRLQDDDGEQDLEAADSHAIVVGHDLAFVRGGALRLATLDRDRRQLVPATRTLATGVGVSAAGRGGFAASDRLLVSAPALTFDASVRWFGIDGEPRAVIAEPGDYWQVRLSPDGRTAALTVRDPLLRTLDVFTVPSAGGLPQRFTYALAADSDPVWAPDGRRIAFRSIQDGQPDIFARALSSIASGDTADDRLGRSPLDEAPSDWTREGLLYSARSPETGFDIWRLPPSGEPRPVARSSFNEVEGRTSPDGRWLAYASDEGGQYDVYVARTDGSSRVRVSTAGGRNPLWTDGGRAILFQRGEDVMRTVLDLRPGQPTASVPAVLFTVPGLRDLAVAPDGSRVLALARQAPAADLQVRAVVNWRSLPPRP